MLTPPDVISQLALAVPMCLLYEAGIFAAKMFVKKPEEDGEEAKEKDKDSA